MLDALEGFQADKTMWLDPAQGLTRSGPVASAPPTATSTSSGQAAAQPDPRPAIESAEALRKTLYDPKTRPPARTLSGATAADVSTDAASLEPVPLGTVINERYKLIANQGAGGIGQVFDAIDLSRRVETHVTLKIVAVNLKHEPYAFEALEAAVGQSRQLQHPNIVRVYDIGRYENRVFITMEPLRGRWLSGVVREVRRTGMPFEAAWPIIAGIANGLAYAHKRGVVHSDLSPHAVFVGDDGTAKIVGFGLINAVPASNESLDVLDTLTLRAYTEAYTADAWAQQGAPHPADDLYPLGVMAYEMLTGAHPFQRCSLTVARQKGLTYEPIAGLNRRARTLIERCLSFDRAVRPKDGHTFVKRMRPGLFERLWPAGA
jgi:serine/threonine protein kinase